MWTPKAVRHLDIYGGTIYVEVESTPDTIVLDKMFKQYQPVNGNIVFKKADEDANEGIGVRKWLCLVDYEEPLNHGLTSIRMTIKFSPFLHRP